MVRPGRNWAQRKCDQLIANCDHMLINLKQLHELYTYGPDGHSEIYDENPDTGELEMQPHYPGHVEMVESISTLVIMLQEVIKKFKTEHV